jgi:hypothetical protein
MKSEVVAVSLGANRFIRLVPLPNSRAQTTPTGKVNQCSPMSLQTIWTGLERATTTVSPKAPQSK